MRRVKIHDTHSPPYRRSMRLDEKALAQLREYFTWQPVKQAYLYDSFAGCRR